MGFWIVTSSKKTSREPRVTSVPATALRNPPLKALLERQREQTRALERRLGQIVPRVFWRSDGLPIRDYYSAWHSACDRAAHEERNWVRTLVCPELVGRIPHDFHRTAVRNLIRAGAPEKTAMLLTGHKTRAVFDRYDIVNEADLADAVGKLARLHGARETVGIQSAHRGIAAR